MMRVEGSMFEWAADANAQLAKAWSASAGLAGRSLVLEMRQRVQAAGLGPRLANAIRGDLYQPGTIKAAYQIFARGSAEKILDSYQKATTIRGKGGQWLAIPTDFVPRTGKRRMTPAEVARHYGRGLRSVKGRNNTILLIMDEVVSARSGRGVRSATHRRRAQGRDPKSVIMFVLVKQVATKKRFQPFDDLHAKWMGQLPDLMDRALGGNQ